MKKFILLPIFLYFLFLISPHKISAVTLTINQYPSSITSDPFSVGVSVTGASEGQNYLRVSLYRDGTSNYFGETYNGNNWYGSSDGKQYFPIIIDSSKNASASVQARVGSPSFSEFPGAGSYKLKIRRYTSSGNSSSNDTQNPVDITINFSPPTPTPNSEPTKQNVSNKVNPAPTKIPTTSSMKQSLSVKEEEIIEEDDNSIGSVASILGLSTESAIPTTSEKDKDLKVLGQKNTNIYLFVVAGGIFMFLCGILAYFINKTRLSKDV